MPRIRSIKPEFWTSEAVAEWHPETRLTFIGLLTMAEDNGVGVANARLLASQLYPLDDPAEATVRVQRALTECSRGGQITLYEHSGKRLYFVNGWDEHQRVNRPSRTRFPRPEECGAEALTSEKAGPRDSAPEPSPSPRDGLTESSVRAHPGIGGMGEGEGGRGRGVRAPARATPPAEHAAAVSEVVNAWAAASPTRPGRSELADAQRHAAELIEAGNPLPAVVEAARRTGADGYGPKGFAVALRKMRAEARPQRSWLDDEMDALEAMKGRPPGRGQVVDAEVVELPRAAGGDR